MYERISFDPHAGRSTSALLAPDLARGGTIELLFAAALFFAGMSAKLATPRLRRAMLALGLILFVGTVAWLATFPVSVSV